MFEYKTNALIYKLGTQMVHDSIYHPLCLQTFSVVDNFHQCAIINNLGDILQHIHKLHIWLHVTKIHNKTLYPQ